MQETIARAVREVGKAVVGKREIIEKTLTAMLARGHILLDDVPGVGKTTLALALRAAMGLEYRRVQFTPDVLPSDIIGFSVYNRAAGSFDYMPGAVTGVNLLLGDEINRTSSKTQSALLEAMEEGQVTVDGVTRPLLDPFIVVATQNSVGAAGTQLLPYAQLDRFLVRLSIGYPDYESQMEIIRGRQTENPLDKIEQVTDAAGLLALQEGAARVTVKDSVVAYVTRLAMATRDHPAVELGVSPRGALFVNRMAKSRAFVAGRSYAVPEDVRAVFADVCAHRIIMAQKARLAGETPEGVLAGILDEVPVPDIENIR